MKIYVDSNSCIKAVNATEDASLTELVINDNANPFNGWSEDKICCYRVGVSEDGFVTMMTPYVDSRLLEHFDLGGRLHGENSEGLFDVAELAGENSEAAYDLAETISSLVERVAALERKVG